ncbi:MAG: hypothetical protein ABI217_03265 [Chthoniobacterales bacterium]
MKSRFVLAAVLVFGLFVRAEAQVPDAAPSAQPAAPAAQPAPVKTAASPAPKFLGNDVPIFDPASEVVSWDGHNWNLNNNRIFEARFEKYLNAPAETSAQSQAYQNILSTILAKLAPADSSNQSVDEAFRLLARASNYEIDAHLCDALADAVYSVWRAQDSSQRLAQANVALEQERKANEWNAQVASQQTKLDSVPPKDANAAAQWAKEQQTSRDLAMQPYTTRLTEIVATIKANQAKKELSLLEAKIEFQALFVQLFLQRRFQHVLVGTRFYRDIFNSGESKLEVGKDTKDLFAKSSGLPPTVGTLDSLAHEPSATCARASSRSGFFCKSTNCRARRSVWPKPSASASSCLKCAPCRAKRNVRCSSFRKRITSSSPPSRSRITILPRNWSKS